MSTLISRREECYEVSRAWKGVDDGVVRAATLLPASYFTALLLALLLALFGAAAAPRRRALPDAATSRSCRIDFVYATTLPGNLESTFFALILAF